MINKIEIFDIIKIYLIFNNLIIIKKFNII
jgi:hypothetical protein